MMYSAKIFKLLNESGTEYTMDDVESHAIHNKPTKILDITLHNNTNTILDKLQPFDGLEELIAGNDSDLDASGLKLLSQAKDLRYVFIVSDSNKILPEDMAYLASIPHLKSLVIDYKGDGDEILKYIAKMKSLRRLYLRSHFSDRGLIHFRHNTTLKELSLRETQITGEGMKYISSMSNLKELDIDGLPIDKKGFREIAKMDQLTKLCISNSILDDKALEIFYGMKKIRELYLDGTRISDVSMPWIGSLPKLQCVYLDGTLVTDVGIKCLFGKKHLYLVSLDKTKVTEKLARGLLDSLTQADATVISCEELHSKD